MAAYRVEFVAVLRVMRIEAVLPHEQADTRPARSRRWTLDLDTSARLPYAKEHR
jgi:hypothetical protein